MRHAIATRYDRTLDVGRNKPVLLACEVDGETVEVVAKFAHRCERRTTALVAESIAALLAVDLDLPIPEPFTVELDPGLREQLSEVVKDWPGQDDLPGFGLARLPAGFATLPVGRAIPAELLGVAAEILAFDVIIDNCDRLPRNPNCMFDGKSLAIFDHELAFPLALLGWRPPWEKGSLDHVVNGPGKHLFCETLRGKSVDLNRFAGALEAVSDARLDQYANALPPQWLDEAAEHLRMLDHVKAIRNHMADIETQIKTVLS